MWPGWGQGAVQVERRRPTLGVSTRSCCSPMEGHSWPCATRCFIHAVAGGPYVVADGGGWLGVSRAAWNKEGPKPTVERSWASAMAANVRGGLVRNGYPWGIPGVAVELDKP